MSYNSLILHVFSGTGNSLRAARWLAELFGADRTHLTHIGTASTANLSPGVESITGLVFPTHGFTAPWAVLRHVVRIPRGRGAAAFVIAARAGTWPGFLLPGLSAGAMYIIALILFCRGYRVKGLRGLDMPSNWMSLHWGISRKNAEKIIRRGRTDIERFAAIIFAGGRHLCTINNFNELVSGIALMPVSAGYLLVGRFGLAKLFYANWRCTSCGLCARECPVGAIRMKGRGAKRPYWTFSCESCMHCMGYCPEKAVEASHPLAVVMYFMSTFSLGTFLGAWLIRAHPADVFVSDITRNACIRAIVDYAYVLLSFFLVYLLFYYLIRIPVVNRFFTCLSLTHYYRRYHEPDTTWIDFSGKD